VGRRDPHLLFEPVELLPFYTETGFLFRENVSLPDLEALFAGREWLFYAYNASATLLTVLLSAGVFYAVDALVNGTPVATWQLLNWFVSLGSTVLIGGMAFGWWRSGDPEHRTMMLVGLVVFSLNAALGYLYTRDRIAGLASLYYALLLGVAASAAWRRRSETPQPGRRLVSRCCS
jgi:hypothetical protein